MKRASPPSAKNYSSLGRIAKLYPTIRPYISEIIGAYKDYRLKFGNPGLVVPISGTLKKIETIREILKDCYKSERICDNLQWISQYRVNHGHASCPMCGAMHVRSIDHYLPQSWYPEFAVFSFNLIPSCQTCNQKRSDYANAYGTVLSMLHPFFEGEEMSEEFLSAVNIGTYEAPHFLPSAYHSDPLLRARIGEHIRRSIDNDLFQTWVMDRWAHLRSLAGRKITISSLSEELNAMLKDEVRLTGANNWSAALYRGVLRDPDALQYLVSNPDLAGT